MRSIKYIAFDADDTLWSNEPMFRNTEEKFFKLMRSYGTAEEFAPKLFKHIVSNLELYGYGTKGLTLSLIEFATKHSKGQVGASEIDQIIQLGRDQLNKEVELLPHVETVISQMSSRYELVLATKGDLLEQEQKLEKSGLTHYFKHISIMSEKNEESYRKLLDQLEVAPSEFLMIGNSFKSDVIPVLNIGAKAIHIPFYSTWAHETVEEEGDHENLIRMKSVNELSTLFPTN